MADPCPTCGAHGGGYSLPGLAHWFLDEVARWSKERAKNAKTIRSLRAKLMRERANTHEWVASMVDDGLITPTLLALEKSRQYHARARRLRAEAERVEGGKP